tara:strand:- start:42 stop:149 length:108 start_codon:yes stop_codon:yes gene_type:complete
MEMMVQPVIQDQSSEDLVVEEEQVELLKRLIATLH